MDIGIKHSFKTLCNEGLGLCVFNCGFQTCDPLHSFGPAVKNHHIIHVVAYGKGTFSCKGKSYSLNTGDGFICTANELISYCADENEPWKYYWVGFGGVDAARLISACGLSADNPCFHSEQARDLIYCIMQIYASNGNKLFNEVEMSSHLYGFFAKIIKERQSSSAVQHKNTDYISAAVKFIEYNYSGPISITDIAESAGISRSHLYRIFMNELNITPNEYLIQYRISNACKLLREGSVNISEAAYSSGFSDPLYFSRVFKKEKGITPSDYVKKSKQA